MYASVENIIGWDNGVLPFLAPSHYLNWSWLMVKLTLSNEYQWNLTKIQQLSHKNLFENVVCKMVATWSGPKVLIFYNINNLQDYLDINHEISMITNIELHWTHIIQTKILLVRLFLFLLYLFYTRDLTTPKPTCRCDNIINAMIAIIFHILYHHRSALRNSALILS